MLTARDGTIRSLQAEGHTVVAVSRDGLPLGVLAPADAVRPQAAGTVDRLRAEGLVPMLDAFRIAGAHLGYLPDSTTMFGNLITGAKPMADPTTLRYTLGTIYHLFNGISFALVYSIVFGRTRWWGPVLYSVLFVETGMMVLPPMEPQFGPFGLDKYGTVFSGYYQITLLAHLAMGLALAAVIHTMARHRGLLPEILTRRTTAHPA
ncbi:hypothetical protein [Streptomyces sp. UG1]|uniref:hypothetical protein n=1 Tax=Streptomyces sp. UG1 TaxID=3417652 RepID=UPI003CEBF481